MHPARTLDLEEAADFLKVHPQTLRRLAKQGTVPGAKVGKCWCFLEEDLVDFLRSRYAHKRQVPQGANSENMIWHSINAAKYGGSALPVPADSKYADLLGLKTKSELRNTKTG